MIEPRMQHFCQVLSGKLKESNNQKQYFENITFPSDGRILAAGGIGEGERYLDSVEIFHPNTKQWEMGEEVMMCNLILKKIVI